MRRDRTLPAFLLAAALTAGCGSGASSRPAALTPAELAFGQEDYAGQRVETTGTVRRFGPEDGATRLHFVLEDAAQNRVQLDGGHPERFVGEEVTVIGRFRYADGTGRHIEVEEITTP